MNHYFSKTCVFLLAVALTTMALSQNAQPAASHPNYLYDATFTVALSPSSVVVKVGETAKVNVTISDLSGEGQVCFKVEGFPETGFRTTFNPECIVAQSGVLAVLSVEATPAAAPQTFTALVIATYAGQTAQAPVGITVEPAMPAWIPWLGLGLFLLFLGVAVFWKPRLPFKRSKMPQMKGKSINHSYPVA